MGQKIRLKRHQDWPLRLSRFLSERQDMPFEWGKNDCLLFCADCVNALTGVDPAAKYRQTYATEMEARFFVLNDGGGSVSNMITDALGDSRPYPKINQRGDIVVSDFNGTACAGVIDDTGRRVAFLTQSGLIRVPLNDTMMIWGY